MICDGYGIQRVLHNLIRGFVIKKRFRTRQYHVRAKLPDQHRPFFSSFECTTLGDSMCNYDGIEVF